MATKISREKAEFFEMAGVPYEGHIDGVGYQSLRIFSSGTGYLGQHTYCIPQFQPVIDTSPEERIKSLKLDGDDLIDKLVKMNNNGEPTINMGHGKYRKLSDNCEIVAKVDDGERFSFGYRDRTTGKAEIIEGKLTEFDDIFAPAVLADKSDKKSSLDLSYFKSSYIIPKFEYTGSAFDYVTAANNALIGIVNSVPESWNLLIDATESVVGGTVKEDLSSIGSAVSSSFNKDITNIKKDPWGWTKEAGQYMLSPEAFEIYVTAVGGAKIVKANPFKSPPKPKGNLGASKSVSKVPKSGDAVKSAGKKVDDVGGVAAKASNIGKTIHSGKQGKHIIGHNNYQSGKSILKSDAQSLLDDFHAGNIKSSRVISESKTSVDFGKTIGDYVKDGVSTPTSVGTVINSNSGVHIVPANPIQF